MSELRLASGYSPRVVRAGSHAPLADDELALVTLDGFELRPGALYSKDIGKKRNREGTITLEINGQPTTLSWATEMDELKNASGLNNKFQNNLLYFGTPTGGLDCAVTVLESDEDVRRALGNVQSGVTRLAAAAGSVPGYGTAASAGLTLASGVIDLIRQCIDDDVELSYHGILDDDEQHDFAADLVEAGRYRLVRPNRDSMSVDEPDVKLDFTVHRFKPWQARGDREPQLAVVIDRIEIEPSEAIQKLENNENARLFFEATLGAGKAARSYSFQQSLANGQATLNRVFGLRHKRVYVGPYRMGVPLAMNLALVCDQAELQMIEGLASHAATFVGAIGDEEAKKMASQVTKGVQTVRSIVTEFLPQKISVGQVSKLLVTGQHGFPGGARPGCVLTVEDPSDWTRVNVELQSQTGGKATVILKVKAI